MSVNPTKPQNAGFPQAYSQQPYQPVSQFNQYASPQPQPSTINNGHSTYTANPFPFPQPNNNFPVKPPVTAYNQTSTANHQFNNMQIPAPQIPATIPPPSHQPPSFPQAAPAPIVNGYPAAPAPSAFPNARPAPMPSSFPNAAAPPPFPTPAATAPAPSMPQPNGLQYPAAPAPAPSFQAPPTPGAQYPIQPNPVNQMNQQFGQMNMNPMAANSQYRSDVIDLMTERNIQQYGFDDIDVQLPTQVANPEAHVDPNIFRSTLEVVPNSEELLKKSRLPLAITLHPFRDVKNLNIIQTTNIVRCRYCRTYINPYVYLPDHRHWKCNLCNRNNDLPDDFCWDPVSKSFGDPRNRPEIQNATVEFIAPSEYMLRPPQPAVYVFVLDVSANAIQSGYLRTFSEQLLINIDQMPGDERAQIAFIAVDSCLHFFSFNSQKRGPCEMIVDDVEDAFLPAVTSLLVPIKKFGDVIRTFIKNLPTLYSIGPTSNGNCLGSALRIVHQLISEIGGRISIFQATLPNLGLGALQSRDDGKSSDGGQNLGPATDFYKALSLDCTGNQVCLDLFMFNTQYADLATISEVAKFSTGCIYYFPNYNVNQNGIQVKRFEKTFTRYLTRKIGFEAVLRIRTTRGLALTGFYGNFFVRSPDLLALANVNPDSALAVQVTIEEKLSQYVCFQSALLYTSSKGDRRIRVHTMCLPTTGDLLQLYNNFDLKATVSYLSKIGIERSMCGAAIADSREALVNAVVDSVGAYQKAVSRGGGMLVPRTGHLRLFPSYVLALLKHPAFTSARGIRLDDRVASMLMLRFSPLEQILSDIYPKLYRLNELMNSADDDKKNWPKPLPLSFEQVQRDGIYAMEAGSAFYVYVSAASDHTMVQSLFECPYNEIQENSLVEKENEISKRVFAFFKHITLFRFYLGPIITITEHSPLREQFVRRLVDDRSESTHSYIEFLQHLKREIGN
ncbi:unnamed protein product [Caenorhabditis bovis]|uniref:Uncharacterized protein n=1 Tax=Caenorhabditis bovis TaxID=2654633 RepID=A0A8S1F974_9PELO|nr:unnamed protein product [Caenorhabditis bovis]